jgi:hypothetical protein
MTCDVIDFTPRSAHGREDGTTLLAVPDNASWERPL